MSSLALRRAGDDTLRLTFTSAACGCWEQATVYRSANSTPPPPHGATLADDTYKGNIMKTTRRHALTTCSAIGLAFASGRLASANPEAAEGLIFDSLDAWLVKGGNRHRIVFDATTPMGLGMNMKYATNFFAGNEKGYGISPDELSVLLIMRHDAASFGFNDAMWEKYGNYFVSHTGIFDPLTQTAPRTNLYSTQVKGANLPNGAVTLPELTATGARFAVCAIASTALARSISHDSGSAEAVLNELKDNMIPNAIMVPAGIVAVNRAQERGYAFSYCG